MKMQFVLKYRSVHFNMVVVVGVAVVVTVCDLLQSP